MRSKEKIEVLSCAAGKKFETYHGDGSSTPWLDNDKLLQQSLERNQWIRWDGAVGTAQEHMAWMKAQAQSFMSDERHAEFRPYGKRKGVQYYIHDEMTARGNGYGFFKLVGTFDFEPKDFIACMFDYRLIVEMDETVVLMKTLQTYTQEQKGHNPFVTMCYWCNAPGFPFQYRDGLDMSGYLLDGGDDGTLWQLSTTIRSEEFQSHPNATAATNRYWAYKLEPVLEYCDETKSDRIRTRTTLVCQTQLNGCIPKFLSNYMLCSVLIDYMAATEEIIHKNKKRGKHAALLKELQLSDL